VILKYIILIKFCCHCNGLGSCSISVFLNRKNCSQGRRSSCVPRHGWRVPLEMCIIKTQDQQKTVNSTLTHTRLSKLETQFQFRIARTDFWEWIQVKKMFWYFIPKMSAIVQIKNPIWHDLGSEERSRMDMRDVPSYGWCWDWTFLYLENYHWSSHLGIGQYSK